MIDVFNHPTIAQLSRFIDGLEKQEVVSAINKHELTDSVPLSYAQERLWFIDKLEGSLHYHMPAALRFTGNLDIDALENAIVAIVNRHEAIRTVFEEVDGKAYQKVLPADQWQLDFTPISDYSGTEQDFIRSEVDRPFNLNSDHMLRAHLLQTGEAEYLLVFVMHHIASDGWSMSILVEELMEL